MWRVMHDGCCMLSIKEKHKFAYSKKGIEFSLEMGCKNFLSGSYFHTVTYVSVRGR